MPDELTHAELTQRLSEGQTDAVTQVYAQYVGQLIALAKSKLNARAKQKAGASAVVQSAIASFALNHAASVNLSNEDELWHVLLKITLRHCGKWNKRFRADKRAAPEVGLRSGPDGGIDPPDHQPPPDEEASLHDIIDQLANGMKDLPREVFKLRLQDYTLAEIAKELNLSVTMVHKTMEKVRAHVSAQLNLAAD